MTHAATGAPQHHSCIKAYVCVDVMEICNEVIGIRSDVMGVSSDIMGVRADVMGVSADVIGVCDDVMGIVADVRGRRGDLPRFATEPCRRELLGRPVARYSAVFVFYRRVS